MIIANTKQQELLLETSKLDLATARAETSLAEIENSKTIDEMRSTLLSASQELLDAHARQENIQVEIEKVSKDLEMVEARIAHDDVRAKSVSNEREQKAINQEIASLMTRKSNLEDSELELLDELDQAKANVEVATSYRVKLNLELESALKKQHGEALTASAQLSELKSKREAIFRSVEPDLQLIYSRKADRGIAVAQTLGRDCSACRLAINAVQFEAMMAEPADHLPTCPNCDALIIR
jgi:predicted  nucleic acid-binding Zn-ribbon protein